MFVTVDKGSGELIASTGQAQKGDSGATTLSSGSAVAGDAGGITVAAGHGANGGNLSLKAGAGAEMGGRVIAKRQRMSKADKTEEWTEIQVSEVEYEVELTDSLFTLSNLRNPRD